MARCEDCFHYEVCSNVNGLALRVLLVGDKADERCKMFKPSADVVPKSEVKETVEKLMSATDKVICEAKQEVAREIFEEIEEALFDNHCVDDGTDYPTPHYFEELKDDIAELKKKYTESEDTK